jgi:hypothetical protein
MTELWIICLAVATPIAGVVGFAIQIRTVRKVRLENSKLELEIVRLQKELKESDKRIVLAEPKEIEKYGGVRFSVRGPCPGPDEGAVPDSSVLSSIASAVALFAILAGFILFVLYLGYDIYRVGAWLWSLL